MGRRRITGRFYIFIALLGLAAYFALMRLWPAAAEYAVVSSSTASNTRSVQAIIMRDELVATMDGNSTIVYIAPEQSVLAKGDEVAYIYSAGYSAKEMSRLESIRQDIRAYHTTLLKNILDTKLELLDQAVQDKALQLKRLVRRETQGSLINVEAQLTAAMEARQEYLRQNQREDTKLNELYDEEEKRETNISSWRSVETAARGGIVSFYLDGYEQYLTPDNLTNITADALRSILAGEGVAGGSASRLTSNIYRLVDPEAWYVLVLTDEGDFVPAQGQAYRLTMAGYEDVVYSTVVSAVQKTGSESLIVLKAQDPIGPLIDVRSGGARISTEVEGLYVPRRALHTQSGTLGVTVFDGTMEVFVPVQELSRDAQGALIQPLAEGTLKLGDYVVVR